MQHRLINIFLIVLLAAVCIFLTVNLMILYRNSAHLPAEASNSIVSILASENIRISPSIISTKRESGTVYVCSSEDYSHTVAQLLGNSRVKYEYIIPDGSIYILENSARLDFGSNFSFSFSHDGSEGSVHDVNAILEQADEVKGENRQQVEKAVADFLDSGSRKFNTSGINIVTEVKKVVESG